MKITVTLEFEVEGEYIRGADAVTSGPPDNWCPADPDEFEIHSVTLAGTPLPSDVQDDLYGPLVDAVLAHVADNPHLLYAEETE